jgi:hypothetical protein
MNKNANEEEVIDITDGEELEANEELDEADTIEGESDEVSEEHLGEETDEDDESISVDRREYEKLRREASAARRLREKISRQDFEKGDTETTTLDQELIARTFLAAQAGITDKEVQHEALRLADKFGMNIAQAMDDPDISLRLKNLQKQKEAKKAIAKSTGGSASRQKDASYYKSYFKQHGDFPDGTPNAMIVKVMDSLN